jgi:tetratricopeptide (TPR) repeat protein
VAIYRQHANDENFEVRILPAGLSDEAFVQRALGRLNEAEALWRETLSYAPRLPAKYAYMGIAPKTFLAQLFVDRGDVPNADAMATQAVQQLRAESFVFQLPQALVDLGNVRRLERRYPEAESLIQEGTDRFARVQGDDNPNVAFGLAALAMTHHDQGNYEAAEHEARRALAIVETLPHTSHYYADVIAPLGRILNKTGRLSEAERLFREALALREKTAPRRSNAVGVALGDVGECLVSQKRYAEAEPLLTESYVIVKAIHVPQSPGLREAAQRLVTLYRSWGKPQQADQYSEGGQSAGQSATK